MMKITKTLLLFLCCCFNACDEDTPPVEEPERTNALATFTNNAGAMGCGNATGFEVTFIVSYRDIQATFDVEDNNSAFLTLLVEDGETINVEVQNTETDMIVASASVSVRTESRPAGLGARMVEFCNLFDLNFINF